MQDLWIPPKYDLNCFLRFLCPFLHHTLIMDLFTKKFLLLHYDSNNLRISSSLLDVQFFGVLPKTLTGCLFSVFWIISLQISKWPYPAAWWSGVFPSLSAGFLFATFSIISWQISKWPFQAARWRGVIPLSFAAAAGFLFSTFLIISWQISRWPFTDAPWSGAQCSEMAENVQKV